MGRKLRSHLSFLLPGVEEKVIASQWRQKKSHDRGSKERKFRVGDKVLVKNFATGPKWLSGVVTRRRGPVAVEVQVLDGRSMRRHYDHICADSGTTPATVPVMAKPEAVAPGATTSTDEDFWYDEYPLPEREVGVQKT